MSAQSKVVKNFNYDGRSLEVREEQTPSGISIRVFEGGKPVASAVYGVAWQVLIDAQMSDGWYSESSIREDLAQVAMRDFINWSNWIKANKKK